jgi:hypothetical protein
MLAHMKGMKKTSCRDSDTKLEDVGFPRWGLRKCQLLATLCVSFSLTLFALGGADLTGRFCLRTLSFGRPTTIMRPIWDTFTISHAVIADVCKHRFTAPFTMFPAPVEG